MCVSFNMTHVIKGPFIAEDRTRIKYNDMDFSSPLNKCSIMVKLSQSGKVLYKQNKTKMETLTLEIFKQRLNSLMQQVL